MSWRDLFNMEKIKYKYIDVYVFITIMLIVSLNNTFWLRSLRLKGSLAIFGLLLSMIFLARVMGNWSEKNGIKKMYLTFMSGIIVYSAFVFIFEIVIYFI